MVLHPVLVWVYLKADRRRAARLLPVYPALCQAAFLLPPSLLVTEPILNPVVRLLSAKFLLKLLRPKPLQLLRQVHSITRHPWNRNKCWEKLSI